MRKALGLRMLLRSPVKTVVSLLLIAAAGFLFLYNLLDYAMTKREYARTYASYRGCFSILEAERPGYQNLWSLCSLPYFFAADKNANRAYDESMYPYDAYHLRDLDRETLERVAALPYVTSVSARYFTGGRSAYPRLLTENANVNTAFFDYNDRLVLTGTLETVDRVSDIASLELRGDGYSIGLSLSDVEVLAGDGEILQQSRLYRERGMVNVGAPVVDAEKPLGILYMMNRNVAGQRGVASFAKNVLHPEDLDELRPGERYVLVCTADRSWGGADHQAAGEEEPIGEGRGGGDMESWFSIHLWLANEGTAGWWPYFVSLEGQPENWLETEDFAMLRQIMALIDSDAYTLDVHYADDMSVIRRYLEGKLLPVQGRMLTPEDTESRNPVCVIPDTFAERYGLSLGDTLHLELGDKLLEQYAPMGAVAYSPARYAENWTGQDFTVVGTFIETGLNRLADEDQYWAYGDNAVFVPLSFLPRTADTEHHAFKPPEVSFVIGDADSILLFRDECLPLLKNMGYAAYFFDGGWPAVSEQLHQAGSLTLVKLLAFAASGVLVLWLTVYLYILRKKKEFAVMRALGCPVRQARQALLFPLFCLAAPASLLGAAGAVIYTHRAAENNAAEFAVLGVAMDTSIPVGVLLLGFLGSLAILAALALAALERVAKKPPLALLQGSDGQRPAEKRSEPAAEVPPAEPGPALLPELPEPVYRSRTALAHTLRYVGRHLSRTPVKALLSLLLALVLAFSIGFFTLLRSTYRDLYQHIEIHPRFVNGFSYTKALEAEKSGLVRDPYYEYMDPACESNFLQDTLILSNDFTRVCSSEVTWREGKGPGDLTGKASFCVVSRDLAEALGYELGSRLEITGYNKISYIAQSSPELSPQELLDRYHEQASKLNVIGIAEETGRRVYASVAAWELLQSAISTTYLPLDIAEYTLTDYHRATELRSYAQRALTGSSARFSMETEEADRIYQTYRLLETLYPIAFALALILGGVLPAGVILQSAREASLLRVLGTTKRRTRAMLSLEQIFLCALGLGLAAAALWLSRGGAAAAVAGLVLTYILGHLVSCALCSEAAAVSVTRRNVLDLLQTKE